MVRLNAAHPRVEGENPRPDRWKEIRETMTRTPQQDFRRLAETFDRHSMAEVIEGTPDQIEFALSDPAFPEIPKAAIERVILAGMGGSALPGNVLADAFEFSVPFEVCRQYSFPSGIDESTLLIACSFSGNTEETVEALQAIPSDSRATIVVVTAGGKLLELAEERGYPVVRIPKEREVDGFQPRCATGYVMTYVARILASCHQ